MVWLVEHNSIRHVAFSMLIHPHTIISIHGTVATPITTGDPLAVGWVAEIRLQSVFEGSAKNRIA